MLNVRVRSPDLIYRKNRLTLLKKRKEKKE